MSTDNKYLTLYTTSLNLPITPTITAQDAKLIAQNVALMHNALGFAIKDLIKIVSFKYNNNNQEAPMMHHYNETALRERESQMEKERNQDIARITEIVYSDNQVDDDDEVMVVDEQQPIIMAPSFMRVREIGRDDEDAIKIVHDPQELDFDQYTYRAKRQPMIRSDSLKESMRCTICKKICENLKGGDAPFCKKCLGPA